MPASVGLLLFAEVSRPCRNLFEIGRREKNFGLRIEHSNPRDTIHRTGRADIVADHHVGERPPKFDQPAHDCQTCFGIIDFDDHHKTTANAPARTTKSASTKSRAN